MLAEAEFDRDLAIAQTIGDKSDYLFFARREQRTAIGINDAQRGNLGKRIHDIAHLLAADPDLSLVNGLNALAQHAEGVLHEKENSLGSGAQGIQHEIAVVIFGEQHGCDGWVSNAQPAQEPPIGQLAASDQGDVDGIGLKEVFHRDEVQRRGGNMKFAARAQGACQQLRLQRTGIGDQHVHDRGLGELGSGRFAETAGGCGICFDRAGLHRTMMPERAGAGCRLDHSEIVMNRDYGIYFGGTTLVHRDLGSEPRSDLSARMKSQA